MSSSWLSFLNHQGAHLENDRVLHFGDPQRELKTALDGDVLCARSQQGLVTVTGADTMTFLQGQFTNDVRQVKPKHSQLNAYCSPKGRALTLLRLFQRDTVYYLSLPREQVEPILKRLRMFILRADVTLQDNSEAFVSLGLSGPHAEHLLQTLLNAVPADIDEVVHSEGVTLIRVPGLLPRFEIYGELSAVQTLWSALAPHTRPAAAEPWRLLDILAGLPTIYAATADSFVPQMINLQLLNGINFRKGCYTGQEVVARTHYLGKLKRRMYQARVNSPTPPSPGDELFALQQGTEQSVGKIVDACPYPEGGFAVLAVVVIDYAESSPVQLQNGAGLCFTPLPYIY